MMAANRPDGTVSEGVVGAVTPIKRSRGHPRQATRGQGVRRPVLVPLSAAAGDRRPHHVQGCRGQIAAGAATPDRGAHTGLAGALSVPDAPLRAARGHPPKAPPNLACALICLNILHHRDGLCSGLSSENASPRSRAAVRAVACRMSPSGGSGVISSAEVRRPTPAGKGVAGGTGQGYLGDRRG